MYFLMSLVALCERKYKHVEEQHINSLKSKQRNCFKYKNRSMMLCVPCIVISYVNGPTRCTLYI